MRLQDIKTDSMTQMYIDINDVAKMLGVSRSTVYNLIRAGKLPKGFKFLNCRRWNIVTIGEYIESQCKE